MIKASSQLFRLLLIGYAVLAGAGLGAAFLPGYSPELAQAYALEPAPLESAGETVLIVIAAILIISVAASFVGLYTFKPWSRPFSLGLTALTYLLLPFLGPQLDSGLEVTLNDASTFLYGAALAMAYWSPVVSEHFDRPRKTPEGAAVH